MTQRSAENMAGKLRPVYLDNEKSGSIWLLAAVWMANILPYGQKLVSTFPEAPSSAIVGSRLTGNLGNVG